ncbi:MAG: flippase-like domain-containing protein [Myxococcales bacterium]|nr:flippase-like domain-containing protein [Myxococcales bacterium]
MAAINRRLWRDPKVYLGFAVSVFFIWLAFRKIDPDKMWQAIVAADPLLIAFIMAQVLAMLFIRGHRWALFLKPVKRVSWLVLGWSTCIGFAVNNLLPARLGEIARSISASRKTGIGFGTAFGTVVVERIYDTITLLVLFIGSLFLWDFAGPMDKLIAAVRQQFGYTISQRGIAVNLAVFVGVVLAAIVLLKWRTALALRVAGLFLRPFPAAWREKILTGLQNFIQGLTQTTDPFEVVWILFLSAALWIISIYSVYVGLLACGIPAGATDAIFVIMSMALAVSIPASPGYVGTYHFLAATAIVLTAGVSWDQALGAAIVIHLANYLPQTLAGLLALAREGLSLKEIESETPRE